MRPPRGFALRNRAALIVSAAASVMFLGPVVTLPAGSRLTAARLESSANGVTAANGGNIQPVALPAAPAITATKSVDTRTHAHLGDTLTYTVVLSTTGSAATAVNFAD